MFSHTKKPFSRYPVSWGPEPWPSGSGLPGLSGIRDTLRDAIFPTKDTLFKVSRIPMGPEPWPSGGVLPGLTGIGDTLGHVFFCSPPLREAIPFSLSLYIYIYIYPVFPGARALALGGRPSWPPWNTGYLGKCVLLTRKALLAVSNIPRGPEPWPSGGVLPGLLGKRDTLRNALS